MNICSTSSWVRSGEIGNGFLKKEAPKLRHAHADEFGGERKEWRDDMEEWDNQE